MMVTPCERMVRLKKQEDKLKMKQDGLIKRFRGYDHDIRTTTSQGDRVSFEEKRDKVERDLKEVEREMARVRAQIERCERGLSTDFNPLPLSSRDASELRHNWKDRLHCLNYYSQENRLHQLVWVKKHKSVLLLMDDKTRMQAELFVKRARKCMQDRFKTGSVKSGAFRSIDERTISFVQSDGVITPERFLKRLVATFPVGNLGPDSSKHVHQLAEAIAQRAQENAPLLLDINLFTVSPDFFDWFLHQFWRPLIRHLPEKTLAQVTVVFTWEGKLPDKIMDRKWYCTGRSFNTEKYFHMRLNKWEKNDIALWTNSVINESLQDKGHPARDHVQLAEEIYKYSKGMPVNASDFILGTLLKRIVAESRGDAHAQN